DAAKKHWQPNDTELQYDGKGDSGGDTLRTEKEYGSAEFIVDFRFPKKGSKACEFVVRDNAETPAVVTIAPDGATDIHFKSQTDAGTTKSDANRDVKATAAHLKPPGQWNRLQVTIAAGVIKAIVNGTVVKQTDAATLPDKGAFGLRPGSEMDFANPF